MTLSISTPCPDDPPEASNSRGGTSPKSAGGANVSSNMTSPVLSFSSDSRLKKIFWETLTRPAASGSTPQMLPVVTTTRSMVKPTGKLTGRMPFNSDVACVATNVTRPTAVSSGGSLSVRLTSHTV